MRMPYHIFQMAFIEFQEENPEYEQVLELIKPKLRREFDGIYLRAMVINAHISEQELKQVAKELFQLEAKRWLTQNQKDTLYNLLPHPNAMKPIKYTHSTVNCKSDHI